MYVKINSNIPGPTYGGRYFETFRDLPKEVSGTYIKDHKGDVIEILCGDYVVLNEEDIPYEGWEEILERKKSHIKLEIQNKENEISIRQDALNTAKQEKLKLISQKDEVVTQLENKKVAKMLRDTARVIDSEKCSWVYLKTSTHIKKKDGEYSPLDVIPKEDTGERKLTIKFKLKKEGF